ncbi:MAG: hypothetical protein Q9O62_06680 [Ardenticatenia bacterium]|nr:hypothetical protein [Ardenticatenia bacterium]
MAWTHYRLVFRLESPLHIGWRKAGNLMQTRRYVPGKNLWAALTEALVHRAGRGRDGRAYQAVGEALKQHFRFGYLWPARGRKRDDGSWEPPTAPHFPWKEGSSPEYWDYLYLDGTARTALDATARTAAEGMLHEVEYIAPYTREGQPVYLVGDLWVRDEVPPEIDINGATIPLEWEQALRRLQIGGERGYGWGRVRLVCRRSQNSTTVTSGYTWMSANGEVCITVDGQQRLTAHTQAGDDEALSTISGPVEPLTGWERRGSRGRNWHLAKAMIVYVPGGIPAGKITVRVHPYGWWSVCGPTEEKHNGET